MTDSTGTLTLTDFLLDRFAELELAAQVALGTAPSEPIEGITPAGAVWFTPEQVLADVAAKRQIVEFAQSFATLSGATDYVHGSYAAGQFALRAIAAAYADHPDFDKGWRP